MGQSNADMTTLSIHSSTSHYDNGPSNKIPMDYTMLSKKRRLIALFNGEEDSKKFASESVNIEYGPNEISPDSSITRPQKSSDCKEESDFKPVSISDIQNPATTLSLFIQAQQQQKLNFFQLSSISQQSSLPLWPGSDNIRFTNPSMQLARVTQESRQKFEEIREVLLNQMSSKQSTSSSSNRRLSSPVTSLTSCKESIPSEDLDSSLPLNICQEKDKTYWERRRKNNEAAKRSRDARRAREQGIALKAQYLEQENLQLKMEVALLRAENVQLFGQYRQTQTLN